MLTPDFFFRQKSEKQPPRRRETFKKPATRNFRFWLPEVAARRGRSVWVPNFLYVSAIECIGGGQRNPTERRLYRGRTPPPPKTRKTGGPGGSRSVFFTFFHFFRVLEHRPRVLPHGFDENHVKTAFSASLDACSVHLLFSCFDNTDFLLSAVNDTYDRFRRSCSDPQPLFRGREDVPLPAGAERPGRPENVCFDKSCHFCKN